MWNRANNHSFRRKNPAHNAITWYDRARSVNMMYLYLLFCTKINCPGLQEVYRSDFAQSWSILWCASAVCWTLLTRYVASRWAQWGSGPGGWWGWCASPHTSSCPWLLGGHPWCEPGTRNWMSLQAEWREWESGLGRGYVVLELIR